MTQTPRLHPASLPKLRGYIETLSDHMPVVSRFYFTDAAGDWGSATVPVAPSGVSPDGLGVHGLNSCSSVKFVSRFYFTDAAGD